MALTGRTHLYMQLAHPIEHVRVNQFLNPIFDERAIDAMVVPIHVRPEDFEDVVPRLARLGNVKGFLVTIPHKEAIARLCDTLGREARLCGSANVARIESDGRMVGDMFDGAGLVAAMRAEGFAIDGRRVLMLGAGGAARSIAVSFLLAGARELVIHNRTMARAQALVDGLSSVLPDRAIGIGLADPEGFDIVVNATSLGLKPDDPLPIDAGRLSPGTLVVDIVIDDAGTPLERAAQARGCRTLGGGPMLRHQLEAMIDFFGERPARTPPE